MTVRNIIKTTSYQPIIIHSGLANPRRAQFFDIAGSLTNIKDNNKLKFQKVENNRFYSLFTPRLMVLNTLDIEVFCPQSIYERY